MRRLRVVVPLSILLIAILLYGSLQSWPLALLVLANLPFAAVGGVVALWLRGLHLSVSASVGFVALFGVAVLNGLVLLTTVQRLRQDGLEPGDAALRGARERLRPVLMTALVASVRYRTALRPENSVLPCRTTTCRGRFRSWPSWSE